MSSNVSTMSTKSAPVLTTKQDQHNIIKFFNGIERLTGNVNFKIWKVRIQNALDAIGLIDHLEHLPQTDEEKQTARTIYGCITNVMTDDVLANMLQHETVPELWNALTIRYDVQTMLTDAVDISVITFLG